jgi:hypothetical protein
MTMFRTRSELRLDELEALRRPLTKAEGEDLRRCLHAIYVRNKRLEFSVTGRVGGDMLEVHKAGTVEANAIAYRMIEARDESWPEVIAPHLDWQENARLASAQLRDAILDLQARAAAA